MRVIISDTSCIITLQKLNRLTILKDLFNQVLITSEVLAEFGSSIPDWIIVQNPIDINTVSRLSKTLDIGESTSIALAKEHLRSLLIIDEKKGRSVQSKKKSKL